MQPSFLAYIQGLDSANGQTIQQGSRLFIPNTIVNRMIVATNLWQIGRRSTVSSKHKSTLACDSNERKYHGVEDASILKELLTEVHCMPLQCFMRSKQPRILLPDVKGVAPDKTQL